MCDEVITDYPNPGYEARVAQEKFDKMVLSWHRYGSQYFTLRNFIGMTPPEYDTWTATGVVSPRVLGLMRWQS